MQESSETAATAPLPEPSTRKERERRLRENEILRAARDLFMTKGFRETTLEEIAKQAEFGKGTLYNYFAGKEELFLGIIKQSLEEMREIARSATGAPGDAREKLRQYARNMIQYVKDNGELLHLVYHELNREDSTVSVGKIRQIFEENREGWNVLAEPLAQEIREGSLRQGDATQLIMLFDGMLRGFCSHQFASGRKSADLDVPALAEMITSVFFDGITERTGKG